MQNTLNKKEEYLKFINQQKGKYGAFVQNSEGKSTINAINGREKDSTMSGLNDSPLDYKDIDFESMIKMLEYYSYKDNGITIAIPGRENFLVTTSNHQHDRSKQIENLSEKIKNMDKVFNLSGAIGFIFSPTGIGTFITSIVLKSASLAYISLAPIGVGIIGFGIFFASIYLGNKYKKEKNILKNLPIELSFSKELPELKRQYDEIQDKSTSEAINLKNKIDKIELLDKTFLDCMICTLGLIHHGNTTYDWILEEDVAKNWKNGVLKMEKLIRYLGSKDLIDLRKTPIQVEELQNAILNQYVKIEDIKQYIDNIKDKELKTISLDTKEDDRSIAFKGQYAPYKNCDYEIEPVVNTSTNMHCVDTSLTPSVNNSLER
jgi:hypothetical protein